MSNYQDLVKEYRKLAKRADQRLVRLEAYQHDEFFKTATKWSYARAMRDIKQWSGEDARRFNTKPPESVAQLTAKIADIKTFLEAPSSSKKGITEIYKKRADTINQRYGTSFSWQQLAEYYESGTAEKFDAEYGSKTALVAIGVIQKSKKDTIDAIRSGSDKNVKVEGNAVIKRTVKRMLNDSGLDYSKLLKGK